MFYKSIRVKIILWYMVIISLVFFLFSLALYQNLSRTLHDNFDSLLKSRAEGIVTSLGISWESEKLKHSLEIRTDEPGEADQTLFTAFVQRWVAEKSEGPFFTNVLVHIFDPDGHHIISSRNIPEMSTLRSEALMSFSQGVSLYDDIRVRISPKSVVPFRMLSIPVTENDDLMYIIRIASPLNLLQSMLKNLRFVLFILIPIGIVVSGLVGSLLAKITLAPFSRIIDTIHKITAENIELRLTVPDSKDEIRTLAETFNKMLDRLERSLSSQRQLIEDMAHELRTPLSILKGELEVTLKRNRSIRQYESVLLTSLEEVNKIIKLVEELLLLAWSESDFSALELNPFDVVPVLIESMEDFQTFAKQKKITMHFSSSDRIVIMGDREKLKRVFLNLLDNAVKYTPPSGKIEVEITQENHWGKIIISDTGVGITENEIPHIFERFYRINKLSQTSSFGLGLSIARSIINAHRGRIEVRSQLNEGSIFTIYLPLSGHDERTIPPP